MSSTYLTYQSCIDSCLRCAAICNHCASSCTQEEDIEMMALCIRLDMECAAICYSAAQLMSLGSSRAQKIIKICLEVCEACGTECKKHATPHCQECSELCLACAKDCRAILGLAA